MCTPLLLVAFVVSTFSCFSDFVFSALDSFDLGESGNGGLSFLECSRRGVSFDPESLCDSSLGIRLVLPAESDLDLGETLGLPFRDESSAEVVFQVLTLFYAQVFLFEVSDTST